jgi:hypothetical protein
VTRTVQRNERRIEQSSLVPRDNQPIRRRMLTNLICHPLSRRKPGVRAQENHRAILHPGHLFRPRSSRCGEQLLLHPAKERARGRGSSRRSLPAGGRQLIQHAAPAFRVLLEGLYELNSSNLRLSMAQHRNDILQTLASLRKHGFPRGRLDGQHVRDSTAATRWRDAAPAVLIPKITPSEQRRGSTKRV